MLITSNHFAFVKDPLLTPSKEKTSKCNKKLRFDIDPSIGDDTIAKTQRLIYFYFRVLKNIQDKIVQSNYLAGMMVIFQWKALFSWSSSLIKIKLSMLHMIFYLNAMLWQASMISWIKYWGRVRVKLSVEMEAIPTIISTNNSSRNYDRYLD